MPCLIRALHPRVSGRDGHLQRITSPHEGFPRGIVVRLLRQTTVVVDVLRLDSCNTRRGLKHRKPSLGTTIILRGVRGRELLRNAALVTEQLL